MAAPLTSVRTTCARVKGGGTDPAVPSEPRADGGLEAVLMATSVAPANPLARACDAVH